MRALADIEQADIPLRRRDTKVAHWLRVSGDATDANKPTTRNLHPDAMAGFQQLVSLAVTICRLPLDESILHRIVPRAVRTVIDVELSIPASPVRCLSTSGSSALWR